MSQLDQLETIRHIHSTGKYVYLCSLQSIKRENMWICDGCAEPSLLTQWANNSLKGNELGIKGG